MGFGHFHTARKTADSLFHIHIPAISACNPSLPSQTCGPSWCQHLCTHDTLLDETRSSRSKSDASTCTSSRSRRSPNCCVHFPGCGFLCWWSNCGATALHTIVICQQISHELTATLGKQHSAHTTHTKQPAASAAPRSSHGCSARGHRRYLPLTLCPPLPFGFVLQSPLAHERPGQNARATLWQELVAYRVERVWPDLLTLPALVLGGTAGGRRHLAPRQAIFPFRRCRDWLGGLRGELWGSQEQLHTRPRFAPEDDFSLPPSVSRRVTTLLQEGVLDRASTALTQDPPVLPTPEVIEELRDLHPSPRQEDIQVSRSLRHIRERSQELR